MSNIESVKIADIINNLNDMELEKLIYNYANKLVDKDIEEETFIKFVDCISRTKFHISSLKHISTIVDLFEMENYTFANSIICTVIKIEKIYIIIINNLIELQKSKSMIGKLSRSINLGDEFIKKNILISRIRMLYNCMDVYMKSFDFVQNQNIIADELLTINNKEEIMNRIILLVKYFGLNVMILANVDIITVNEYKYFNLCDAYAYYQSVIDKIKNYIAQSIDVFDKYVELNNIHNKINKKKVINKKGIFASNNVGSKIKCLDQPNI